MEYLIVALCTSALTGVIFYAGYTLGSRDKKPPQEITEEEKRRIESFNKGFRNLMNYDLNTAMQRRLRDG